jgi:hypothetical protein
MSRKTLVVVAVVAILAGSGLWAKDVYVSAGKSGDGSKGNPYGSIADALDMGAYAGDVIHVTEGVYYGKGGSGKWVIRVNNLTLVGGYDKAFADRNPWKHPSILVQGMGDGAVAEARSRGHDKKWGLDLTYTKASYNPGGMIVGEGEYSGAVIDGFVIDGYTRNTFKPNGDLKTDIGPIGTPLVDLMKPGCKVRNCVVINSGGPGVRLLAAGEKDKPETWSEVSNTIVVNTLMEAIDFRSGTWDADKKPNDGYALVKDNTLAFVWSWLGEGYGILIGRQTNLSIEGNIVAFANDFGMNNGFGNDKAKLLNNCFFNNNGGVYRFFDPNNKVTVVEDDPTKFKGTDAKRKYFLNSNSAGNYIQDPKLKPDPAFFEKFTNQIKSEGGGKVVWDEVNQWRSALGLPLIGSTGTGAKNFAPIFEHEFMVLSGDAVKAGARADPARLAVYQSMAAQTSTKEYTPIKYDEMKNNLGKDVTVSMLIGNDETSGFYVDGVTKDKYVAYRTKDSQHFIYILKGSEALDVVKDCKKNGTPALLSGALVDIKDKIKMANKYGVVVDIATWDE